MSYHSRLALEAALAHLNAATERSYTVIERNGAYVLTIPTGGEYPPVDQTTLLQRLVTMRNAATGREAIKPVTA